MTAGLRSPSVHDDPAGATPRDVGSVDRLRTAFLATGEKFPDALAAGPVAAALNLPLLLIPTGGLPDGTGEALVAAGISQVVVLGGEASISPEVERSVTALGVATVRLGGADRQATASTVADWSLRSAGFDPARVPGEGRRRWRRGRRPRHWPPGRAAPGAGAAGRLAARPRGGDHRLGR